MRRDFFGAFMHGLDLKAIKSHGPISFARVLYGVIGLSIVGFIVGFVFPGHTTSSTGNREGRTTQVFQVQLAKRLETVPVTRDYARKATLRAKEGWHPAQRIAAE